MRAELERVWASVTPGVRYSSCLAVFEALGYDEMLNPLSHPFTVSVHSTRPVELEIVDAPDAAELDGMEAAYIAAEGRPTQVGPAVTLYSLQNHGGVAFSAHSRDPSRWHEIALDCTGGARNIRSNSAEGADVLKTRVKIPPGGSVRVLVLLPIERAEPWSYQFTASAKSLRAPNDGERKPQPTRRVPTRPVPDLVKAVAAAREAASKLPLPPKSSAPVPMPGSIAVSDEADDLSEPSAEASGVMGMLERAKSLMRRVSSRTVERDTRARQVAELHAKLEFGAGGTSGVGNALASHSEEDEERAWHKKRMEWAAEQLKHAEEEEQVVATAGHQSRFMKYMRKHRACGWLMGEPDDDEVELDEGSQALCSVM
jgi:hypothetical protein